MSRKGTSRLYFAISLSLRQNSVEFRISSESPDSQLFYESTCSVRILSVRRRKSQTFLSLFDLGILRHVGQDTAKDHCHIGHDL